MRLREALIGALTTAGFCVLNPDLDSDYIARWAEELGVTGWWRRIS